MIETTAARIHRINPLLDDRWPEFLKRQDRATLFHSPEWLRSLQLTYGYEPSALTTSSPGEELANALVFCRVDSWITGRRLVSVPFADHCTPLVNTEEAFAHLVSAITNEYQCGDEDCVEIRIAEEGASLAPWPRPTTFCLHSLDLTPSLDELFHRCHESCVRRKILRAKREQLVYEEGTSEELLQKFYRLMVLTRRRHHLPPQPISWFRNLIRSFGALVKIRVASFRGSPVASILTICYKNTMTYKYGCSDAQFHRGGPVQFLFWKAIQDAKERGLVAFDLGRTDWSDSGLLRFKDRWGAARSTLIYLRHPAPEPQTRITKALMNVGKYFIPLIHPRALPIIGRILYRHVG